MAILIGLTIAVIIQQITDLIGSWVDGIIRVIAISSILYIPTWGRAFFAIVEGITIPITIGILIPNWQNTIVCRTITVIIYTIAYFWRMSIHVGVGIITVFRSAKPITITIAIKAILVCILGGWGGVVGGNWSGFLGGVGARKEKQENHKNLHGHHTPHLGFWGGH